MIFIFLCLGHLPGQKNFCPGQNWNCPGQNFCPELKSPCFANKSHLKWNFLIGRALKIYLQLEISIFNDFWKEKMDFLTLDKFFVLDNFNIVLDKKYFVRADGQGIRWTWIYASLLRLNFPALPVFLFLFSRSRHRFVATANSSKISYEVMTSMWKFCKSEFINHQLWKDYQDFGIEDMDLWPMLQIPIKCK